MNNIRFAIVLFIIFSTISCKPPVKKVIVSNPESLQGQWKLSSILQDTSIIHIEFGEEKPFLRIDHAKHHLQGFSGCNSFSGGYVAKNDSIKILPLTANQIGCMNNGESIFFKQLSRTNRFQVGKDSLKFLAQDTVLLSFVKVRDKN